MPDSEEVCPRCGQVALIVARSRVSGARQGVEADICNPCGTDEALEAVFDGTIRPVADWPGPRTFENRDGDLYRVATGELLASGHFERVEISGL